MWTILSLVTFGLALWALSVARKRTGDDPDRRLADLDARVRVLTERIWLLEQRAGTGQEPTSPIRAIDAETVIKPEPAIAAPPHLPPEGRQGGAESQAEPLTAAPTYSPGSRSLDLEQRIGARWTTWVGVVAILFALSFFLRWAFENNLITPELRVILGLVSGAALLAGSLSLHRRRAVPYLSEGLAGLGLGTLYLSLYAAHAFYGFLGPGLAFGVMFLVTIAGAVVSVGTSRQVTAALTVLGGLLTPVLLVVEHPDERTLLAYLVVLDLMVFAIARFRMWPLLNWLAWAGSSLLVLPTLLREPESPHPLVRLTLLSALFVLFSIVPLIREWAEGRREREVNLALIVANAAAYFWAVFVTLGSFSPLAKGSYALALAVLYTALANIYQRRVPEDESTVVVHLGVSDVFLTIAIPLALDGPWVTLAWAVQGAALLAVAPRLVTPIAGWGGLMALFLAVVRVAAIDRHGAPYVEPIWNTPFLVHLSVVVALAWGGKLATKMRADQLRILTREGLQHLLWVFSALVLAVLFRREPSGLWPAGLLAAETLALGYLAKRMGGSSFVIATPLVAAILFFKALVEDDDLARRAAEHLVNGPLLTRIAACAALALAGNWVAKAGVSDAKQIGRGLSASAGVALLYVLSAGWIYNQDTALWMARTRKLADEIRWKTQVGLSVLWTLYAAAALGWGFVRSSPAVRYAALALFGAVIFKVFLVDLSNVSTLYRIFSFLILGIVLLGVSFLYQRVKRTAA